VKEWYRRHDSGHGDTRQQEELQTAQTAFLAVCGYNLKKIYNKFMKAYRQEAFVVVSAAFYIAAL